MSSILNVNLLTFPLISHLDILLQHAALLDRPFRLLIQELLVNGRAVLGAT